jgi:calcineurin-like phosphoesterase family protein
MSATWFTSDTHFGHAKMLRVVGRPFRSADEMDEVLITRWNEVVGRSDDVWHLGDFAFLGSGPVDAVRARLNGRIHLVRGNHDTDFVAHSPELFTSIHDIAEVDLGGQTLVLCHYPMREWPKAWRGAWHLFGHLHGRLDDAPLGHSLDVGVDSHDYRPIGMERVAQIMSARVSPFTSEESRDEMHRRIAQTRGKTK